MPSTVWSVDPGPPIQQTSRTLAASADTATDAGPAYTLVTPARNEAANLRRLATSLLTQSLAPARWIVVDDGSTDDTATTLEELGESGLVITVIRPGGRERRPPVRGRGGAVVAAFHAGIAAMPAPTPIVVKLDADVSLEADYFERLVDAFAEDPRLGIASGSCWERDASGWSQRHVTGRMVWGAARAYRWECLQELLPLEERMGWDGIDVAMANVRGWTTTLFPDLPFYHHRPEAVRERTRWHAWSVQGEACHYMGYRPLYLTARTAYLARRDPAAVAMLWSFLRAVLRRSPQCRDERVRVYTRQKQRLRAIPARRREALGTGPQARR